MWSSPLRKFGLPVDRPGADHARDSAHRLRQVAEQEFGTDRAVAQLRMRAVEVVLLLDDVIGELVADDVADAPRPAGVVGDIDAGDLGLLAAVEPERGDRQRRAGRDDAAAVSLVEPFRLHAGLARGRLAAVLPEAEHLHRVGQRRGRRTRSRRVMHRVARRGAAQMRDAGSGNEQVRGIRVVDGRTQPVVALHRVVTPARCDRALADQLDDPAFAPDRRMGQVEHRVESREDVERGAVLVDTRDTPMPVFVAQLRQTH